MPKRFLALAAILLLVGMVTNAFGQTVPDQAPITRAGAVALLVEANPALKARLQHHIRYRAPMPLFEDMDYDQWYAPYIETAFEAGIITGDASGRFRPGAYITEEESIALADRFHAIQHPELMTEMQDARHATWLDGAISAASRSGLKLPPQIHLGQPMRKGDLFALMTSMGIQNPQQIAVSYNPNPAPIIVASAPAPVQNRPRTTPISQIINRPPAVNRPVQQTPPAQQPVPPAPSAKAFAISMPSLGIKDLTITHPSDPFTKDGLLAPLKYGVGHLFSYPGKGGKILVYGHSSSYPWDVSDYTKIFRQINKLNVGDTISITYNGTVYNYQVTYKQTVPAADMSVYQGGSSEELILYTCWPPDSIKERYLVHAKPI